MELTDRPESWRVVASREEFTGPVIGVRTDTVEADGVSFDRQVVSHRGAVGVVAVDDDDRVLVVQQYRHPAQQRMIELPAGLLDVEGEEPLAAAQRELREEGRLEADRWSPLLEFMPTPGVSDERIMIFLAEQVREVRLPTGFSAEHEEASMTIEWVPLADLVEAVMRRRVSNGILIAGSLALWRLRNENRRTEPIGSTDPS